MRTLVLAFCVASLSLAAACGDDSTTTYPDLSTPDLTVEGSQSCLQIVSCGAACGGVASCQATCAAKGSAAAQAQYQALFACAYGQCTVAHDGGTAACASNTDTSATCSTCTSAGAQSTACTTQLEACIGT